MPTAIPPDGTPPTTYTDETASPGTAYTYQVSAIDAAGNESTKASTNVNTPPAPDGNGADAARRTDRFRSHQ